MVITDPAEVHPTWAAAFNAQDITTMKSLGEGGYVFVPQPGVAVAGEAADGAQEQFLGLGLPIALTTRHVLVKDDIALVIADWTITGTGPDGNAVDLAGTTADVLRNGPDGWKFVIDNPFGTA